MRDCAQSGCVATARSPDVLDDRCMPHNVDKLDVYHKALAAAGEVSLIARRMSFDRDRRLREQLGSSSERVASLISEGSEQSTDRHFAEYCHRSKGSARETRTQMVVAAVQRG